MRTTKQLIEALNLPDSDRALFLSALGSDGFILKVQPVRLFSPYCRERLAAWAVLVSNLAPARIPVDMLMLYPDIQAEFLRLDKVGDRFGFALLLNLTEPAYRWNTRAGEINYVGYCEALDDLIAALNERGEE